MDLDLVIPTPSEIHPQGSQILMLGNGLVIWGKITSPLSTPGTPSLLPPPGKCLIHSFEKHSLLTLPAPCWIRRPGAAPGRCPLRWRGRLSVLSIMDLFCERYLRVYPADRREHLVERVACAFLLEVGKHWGREPCWVCAPGAPSSQLGTTGSHGRGLSREK